MWSGYFWREQGCSQAASGKNKGAVMLLLVRTRVRSGCFWQEQGCSRATSGKSKGAVKLLLARTRCGQATSGKSKGAVKLLLARTRVWLDYFWQEHIHIRATSGKIKGAVGVLLRTTRVRHVASCGNNGEVRLLSAAFGENKGVARLFLVRKRVCSGCFWLEQGCGQATSG